MPGNVCLIETRTVAFGTAPKAILSGRRESSRARGRDRSKVESLSPNGSWSPNAADAVLVATGKQNAL
jgi:hypothetical protein